MAEKIDDVDIKIMSELQEDARKSLREIAEKLGVAEGTVYNRIHKLKEMGVIERFIPVINFSKLGYDLTALIGIVGDGKHIVDVEKQLVKENNVTAVYDVTGEFDAIVVAKFKNRSDMDEFIKRLLSMRYVNRTYTMLVLNVLKETHGVRL
jgi:DNA-binding Lrp family transcriptional regulator